MATIEEILSGVQEEIDKAVTQTMSRVLPQIEDILLENRMVLLRQTIQSGKLENTIDQIISKTTRNLAPKIKQTVLTEQQKKIGSTWTPLTINEVLGSQNSVTS
ncbi:MAG: hypothetical protein HQM11_11380 [SAR324 cluster bacterium]|nr:hypothetical protein [SAR324 cluster bacterium]